VGSRVRSALRQRRLGHRPHLNHAHLIISGGRYATAW
jgi:hypothetical protein